MFYRHRAVAALALATIATAGLAADHAHWSYEGREGPEHWGEMSRDFAACGGKSQSPVDLADAENGDNEDIVLAWQPHRPKVTNNGHTIQAAVEGNQVTRLADKIYTLQQMHFHHPSEHRVKGHAAPLEAHFVNKGPDGQLLVLGVLIEEGNANAEIGKLWEVVSEHASEAPTKVDVDLARMVPADAKFFRYEGSLTTPPCSEIVHWAVFVDPISASRQQIETFAKLYPANNRPLQAIHSRSIVFGR